MTRRKGADRRQEARNDNRYFRRVHRQQLQQRGAEQGGHHPIGLRAWRVCERDSGRNDCPSLWRHRRADGGYQYSRRAPSKADSRDAGLSEEAAGMADHRGTIGTYVETGPDGRVITPSWARKILRGARAPRQSL